MTTVQESVKDSNRRHVIPLSGGKDSTALAVYMIENHSNLPLEFIFTDTGAELPETYSYLNRFEAIFGVTINRYTALDMPNINVRSKGGKRIPFDVVLNEIFAGFLPNPQARWCTRVLKIQPFEQFIGSDEAYSYIGIRADENRKGYVGKGNPKDSGNKPVKISDKNNIIPVYPLKDIGYGLAEVKSLLEKSGLGLPPYYEWRSRSGCYFCFYQQIGEWQRLKARYPDLFESAKKYETVKPSGKKYTWVNGRSLKDIENLKTQYPLSQAEEEDGCAICHL
ncbi:MAG: phosphoadenosine phosphosulfate reductase family protein [Rhodobacteraceae bacterium]|nr:phosphoadenosine phosphosulfate reductase family protein [Paracoccaceae bacterium]